MLNSFISNIVSSAKGTRKSAAAATTPTVQANVADEAWDSSSSSSGSDSESDTDSPARKTVTTGSGSARGNGLLDVNHSEGTNSGKALGSKRLKTRPGGSISSTSTQSTVSMDSSIKSILSGTVEPSSLAAPSASSFAVATTDKIVGAHASGSVHKTTSSHAHSVLSPRNIGGDSDKSTNSHSSSAGSLVGTATAGQAHNRPPRSNKSFTALTHIEDELIHHGPMVALTKDCAVMRVHVTVDGKTAQEIQDHTSLTQRQKLASAGVVRSHHSSFSKSTAQSSALHTGAQMLLSPRRRSLSPSVSYDTEEAVAEGGHRFLRSEVPDDLVDSIESLIDAQILQSGPGFAKQTIHSLINAASLSHPKDGKSVHLSAK